MLKSHHSFTSHDSMKALIIYDNFAFAAKANEMLQQSAHQRDAAANWNIRPWRLDSLSLHRSADEALLDATDAHLIIFAGHRTQSLPVWLQGWLERWVACRQIKDATFAVIGGKDGDTLSMPTTPELSEFARKHGLSFIADSDSNHNYDKEIQKELEPEAAPSLARVHFIDAPPYGSRGWGIND